MVRRSNECMIKARSVGGSKVFACIPIRCHAFVAVSNARVRIPREEMRAWKSQARCASIFSTLTAVLWTRLRDVERGSEHSDDAENADDVRVDPEQCEHTRDFSAIGNVRWRWQRRLLPLRVLEPVRSYISLDGWIAMPIGEWSSVTSGEIRSRLPGPLLSVKKVDSTAT